MTTPATVYLVGAGPGAADLLTLRAVRALRHADVVLHDRLVTGEVLELAPAWAEVVDVGKRPGAAAVQQQRIMRLMVGYARSGRVVVRLKGGDPMVFGRGGEELDHLARHGVPVEVITSVTSAIGVPTSVGLPLTQRGVASEFTVVVGETADYGDWARKAVAGTLVVLMGVRRRCETAAGLIAAGRPATEPVAFVEDGSTSRQRIVSATLGEVAAGKVAVASPAVWVIGEVADPERWWVIAAPVPGDERVAAATATTSTVNRSGR